MSYPSMQYLFYVLFYICFGQRCRSRLPTSDRCRFRVLQPGFLPEPGSDAPVIKLPGRRLALALALALNKIRL